MPGEGGGGGGEEKKEEEGEEEAQDGEVFEEFGEGGFVGRVVGNPAVVDGERLRRGGGGGGGGEIASAGLVSGGVEFVLNEPVRVNGRIR